MAKKHEKKTNAMRELDRIGAAYDTHIWDCAEAMSGVEVADHLGLEVARVFKTLVTVGKSGTHYVFMVPVAEELDLKKAAACVGEKSVHMIPSEGASSPYWLHPRWVQPLGDEEALRDHDRSIGTRARAHRLLRRAARLPDRYERGCARRSDPAELRRYRYLRSMPSSSLTRSNAASIALSMS